MLRKLTLSLRSGKLIIYVRIFMSRTRYFPIYTLHEIMECGNVNWSTYLVSLCHYRELHNIGKISQICRIDYTCMFIFIWTKRCMCLWKTFHVSFSEVITLESEDRGQISRAG